jgi:drug/metabolite transporter (DMT)-like permease
VGALTLGLAASACWGVGDYLGGARSKLLPGALVALVSQAVGLVVVGAILVPGGAGIAAPDLLAASVAGTATGLGVATFYKALALGAMSVVAPISATGVIVPVVIGILDGDRLTALQAGGMAVAIVGVGLASSVSDKNPRRRRAQQLSIILALIGALLIGISLAAFDRAAAAGPLEAVLWARVASVSVLGILCLLARPDTGGMRGQVPALIAIGLLDVSGTVLYTTATGQGLLSIVAVAASLYPVSTIFLARLMLGERLPVIQAAGVLAALAGVAAVATG